jgi:hypothetical protein
MAATMSKRRAKPIATSVEIHCPECAANGQEVCIPATDGSYLWLSLPDSVTCPECQLTFIMSTKITI